MALVAFLGCDQEKPVLSSPASRDTGKPLAPPPAAPVSTPSEQAAPPAETPLKTADGEFVGSVSNDYLSGKVCQDLFFSGQYDQDLVFEGRRNLAEAGAYSAQPCDASQAVASCKKVKPDGDLIETLIGYYYDIEIGLAKQDCADDGGVFSPI